MNAMKNTLLFVLAALLMLSACAPQPVLTPDEPPVEPTPVEEPVNQETFLISDQPRQTSPAASESALAELVSGNTAFALNLYQMLARQPGNLFYSPYSISLALAMTYAGARAETEQQMAQALHFNLPQAELHPAFNLLDQRLRPLDDQPAQDEEQPFQLNIANSLWGQQDFEFLDEFLDTLAANYGAGMYRVNYNQPEDARLKINAWVEDQTRDKIKDLIQPGSLSPLTRLVLANAIYFKAAWQSPFDKEATSAGEFTLLDGSEVSAEMMSQWQDMYYLRGEDFAAVDLAYRDSNMSMLVIVPDAGKFADVEAGLTPEGLETIRGGLAMASVRLSMPKFSFESSFGLSEALKELGMPAAFDDELADFSGMTGKPDLVISDVVHKAFVDVNEDGTEAAAATAVIMKVMAMPLEEAELTIDRPFLFLIQDRSNGTVLFLGRVVDPR
ncbi:MAG: serpin family protein [Bellilinea sp.]